MQPDITEEIKKIVQPVLDVEGAELVGLIYRREAGRYVLRLLVDKAGGISLDDCTRINRTLSDIFDKTDLIRQSFVLEVNSPGLDRPMAERRDFQKNIGNNIKLIAKNEKGTTDTLIGRLKSVKDDGIILDIKGSESQILFENIIKAKMEINL